MENLTAKEEANEYCLKITENCNGVIQIPKKDLQKLIFVSFLKGVEREQNILKRKKFEKLNRKFLKDEEKYNR